MEHRRFLLHHEPRRPFVDSGLFDRIGGRATVETLVDGLYDGITTDAALRPLFGRTMDNERAAQKRFFTEWLGGEGAYSADAYLPLKHRHDLLPITPALADRWLVHFRRALELTVPDAEPRVAIDKRISTLALALINEGDPPSLLRARPHGSCLRYGPAIESLALARRGEVSALDALIDRSPDVLASEPHAATLLQLAVLGGRTAAVQLLLDRGVAVDKPAALRPLIFLTPLAAARLRRRTAIESMLRTRGAVEDVFTHAFLGDLPRLREDLERDPLAAQAIDPAVDALEITPVHHAVAGEQLEALRLLLAASNRAIPNAARALRDAVALENVPLVRLLLERGVDAASVGAGRWVLHPELAPLLSAAGAHVDRTGAWIGLSCTGNQGRKDDPAYVAALLRHGARADDRRLVGQHTDGGHATALHYAAKAGFLRTMALLLEHGADPTARDDNGRTPADWLDRATKSIDRAAVQALLRRSA